MSKITTKRKHEECLIMSAKSAEQPNPPLLPDEIWRLIILILCGLDNLSIGKELEQNKLYACHGLLFLLAQTSKQMAQICLKILSSMDLIRSDFTAHYRVFKLCMKVFVVEGYLNIIKWICSYTYDDSILEFISHYATEYEHINIIDWISKVRPLLKVFHQTLRATERCDPKGGDTYLIHSYISPRGSVSDSSIVTTLLNEKIFNITIDSRKFHDFTLFDISIDFDSVVSRDRLCSVLKKAICNIYMANQ